LIGQNDDGGTSVPADSVTGQNFDTSLTVSLTPGSYKVSVMQYDNHAIGPNLSNGFVGKALNGWIDASNNARSSFWAFDILNAGQASVVKPTLKVALGGPYISTAGETINFNPQITYTGVYALSYYWTYGDGTSSSTFTNAHLYSSPGVYNLTLQVRDSINNLTSTDSTAVTVT